MSMFDIRKIDGTSNPEKFRLQPSAHPRFGGSELPVEASQPRQNVSEQVIDYSKYKSMPFNPETDPINPFEGLPPAKSLEELNARFDIVWERGRKFRDYKNRQTMNRLSAVSAKAMKKAMEKVLN